MYKSDSIWMGISVSIMLTAAVWLGLDALDTKYVGKDLLGRNFNGLSDTFKATIAVFSNVLPFIVYTKSRRDNAMRGVGVMTVLMALFVVVYFFLL